MSGLTREQRRQISEGRDHAARVQVARLAEWRVCPHCLREQEAQEFSNGAKWCRSCEAERLREYHAKKRRDREAV